MGVVVLKGNCPTNNSSCPMGLIVLRGRVGVSGVIVLQPMKPHITLTKNEKFPCISLFQIHFYLSWIKKISIK